MSAYNSARLDDYQQRSARGENLTDRERRDYNALDAEARKEWESKPSPHWLGGDYPDVF